MAKPWECLPLANRLRAVVLQISQAHTRMMMQRIGHADGEAESEQSLGNAKCVEVAISLKQQTRNERKPAWPRQPTLGMWAQANNIPSGRKFLGSALHPFQVSRTLVRFMFRKS
jgi:hypothetical protein